jgi:hypothetical protein
VVGAGTEVGGLGRRQGGGAAENDQIPVLVSVPTISATGESGCQ